MAWIGAIVVVGLAVLLFDFLRERIGQRRARRRAELGLPPRVWSTRRRWVTFAAGFAAVAVVIGVLFLLRGGSNSASRTASLNTVPPSTTTSVPSSTTSPNAGRPPQQVRVVVVNASGVAHAAQQKGAGLTGLGYQVVGLANAAPRPGTAVQCKPGFEQEATTLARNAGGATVEPFPNPPPAGSTNADCVVVVGTGPAG